MTNAQIMALLLLFGGLGGGLLMKIVWDWLKFDRRRVSGNGNGNGKTVGSKMDTLIGEQIKTNLLLTDVKEITNTHNKEAWTMTDRILSAQASGVEEARKNRDEHKRLSESVGTTSTAVITEFMDKCIARLEKSRGA